MSGNDNVHEIEAKYKFSVTLYNLSNQEVQMKMDEQQVEKNLDVLNGIKSDVEIDRIITSANIVEFHAKANFYNR